MSITLKKSNFAVSKLRFSLTAVGTQSTVLSGEGIKFPQDGPFRAVLWNQAYSAPHQDAAREIITGTLSSGDIFNVVRAAEGTTAKAWNINDNIAHDITAGTLQEIEASVGNGSINNDSATQTGVGWLSLKSFVLTGGILGAINAIYIKAIIRRTVGSGGITCRLKYDTTVIATMPAVITSGSVVIEGYIIGAGTSSSQRGYIFVLGADDIGIGTAAVNSTVSKTVAFEIDLETDGDTWACDLFSYQQIIGT